MILVIGESGMGKSTSLRNLNSKATFILQSIAKPLPFRGWRKSYQLFDKNANTGNIFQSDSASVIISTLDMINSRNEIKTIVLDDFQYIMANEFMRRVSDKGFDKFNDIGHNAWAVINKLNSMRPDICCIVLAHSETANDSGKTKIKTLGKMLDDKITVEGMFTVVMQSIVTDSGYSFITQNNGNTTCKSPLGMFEDTVIDNDLAFVVDKFNEYNNEGISELKDECLKEIEITVEVDQLTVIWKRYPELHGDSNVLEAIKNKKTELTK